MTLAERRVIDIACIVVTRWGKMMAEHQGRARAADVRAMLELVRAVGALERERRKRHKKP